MRGVDNVLLISNSYAGSVSPRRKEVIVKALSADCKLEAVDTASRDHATELARDAVDRGFDAVVAFGGDGTINEVIQGLVGSDVALGILPGGTTNVMARATGIPSDPIEATAMLGARLRSNSTRRINLGRVNHRYFVFSTGLGFDAGVVKRVEADPERKRRLHKWHFLDHALRTAWHEYRGEEPTITVQAEGAEPRKVLLAICCNARPFTYFGRFPVDVCPEAQLDLGLDLYALTRMRAASIPRVAWAVLVSRGHVNWKTSMYEHDITRVSLSSTKPLPLQVDGDYIGEHRQAEISLERDALTILG